MLFNLITTNYRSCNIITTKLNRKFNLDVIRKTTLTGRLQATHDKQQPPGTVGWLPDVFQSKQIINCPNLELPAVSEQELDCSPWRGAAGGKGQGPGLHDVAPNSTTEQRLAHRLTSGASRMHPESLH